MLELGQKAPPSCRASLPRARPGGPCPDHQEARSLALQASRVEPCAAVSARIVRQHHVRARGAAGVCLPGVLMFVRSENDWPLLPRPRHIGPLKPSIIWAFVPYARFWIAKRFGSGRPRLASSETSRSTARPPVEQQPRSPLSAGRSEE